MKPFRFGIGIGIGIGQINSRADLAEKARKIEALGYDTLTLPDHLTDCLAPVPAMVSAASATTRLRIGTNVLNNDLRHPVLVAREAAAVDLLTDGRLQLGLGAGSIKSEYDEAGLPFASGRVRVASLPAGHCFCHCSSALSSIQKVRLQRRRSPASYVG